MTEIEGLAHRAARARADARPAARASPRSLDGGITNRNVRVRLGGRDYVLRLCGKDTEVLSIDRDTELLAQRAAHAAGVAPGVVARLRCRRARTALDTACS